MPEETKKNFFTTLPGILTALAAVITAIAGLIKVMGDSGLIQSANAKENKEEVGIEETIEHDSAITENSSISLESGNKTEESTTTKDINYLSYNNLTNKPYWKNIGDEYFYLYLNNQLINNTNSSWVGNSLLVFDKNTNTYYLLRDFKIRSDNQLREAETIESENHLIWRHNNNGYEIFHKGLNITNQVKSSNSSSDKLLYYPDNDKSYLLANYANTNADMFQKSITLNGSNNAFYKRSGNTFWIYYKGESIAGNMKTDWANSNDFLAYHITLNKYFILKGYANAKDEILYNTEIIETPTNAIWKRKGTTFYLYIGGTLIGVQNNWFDGNNLLVKGQNSGLTYILDNYKNRDDNTLRPVNKIY